MNKIVIYGGYGGIGSATARLLHARGYAVHLVGRREDKLKALATELGASYTVGDVEDNGLFPRVAQDAGEPCGGLVYAVGTINLRSLRRLTEEDFQRDFRLNALGAALAVQAALPALKKSADGFLSCSNRHAKLVRGWVRNHIPLLIYLPCTMKSKGIGCSNRYNPVHPLHIPEHL